MNCPKCGAKERDHMLGPTRHWWTCGSYGPEGEIAQSILCCEAEAHNETRVERDRLREAIQNAVDWSNGREYEWGDRAENSFAFLHKALEESK